MTVAFRLPGRSGRGLASYIAIRAALCLGGLISGVLLLAVAEGVMRWFAPQPPSPDLVQYVSALPGFAVSCGANERLGPRQPGPLRLAVVGESSGEMLTTAIAETAPESVRLAGCAQTGSGIEQIEARFNEVVRAEPDAVVIVAGHNLRILSVTGLAAAALKLRAGSHLLSRLPFSRAYGRDQDPQRLQRFESFLRHAAEVSRRRGFQLVLVTMTPNYWVPPVAWTHAGTPRQGDLYRARFLRWSGRVIEAEQLLRSLTITGDPEVEFELGLLLRLSGRPQEARIHLERVIAATMTTRATDATNALIRRIAAEEHLLLHDSLRAAEAQASDAIPGWETVSDHCHLLAPAFARDARAILQLLGVANLPAPGSEAPRPTTGSQARQRESLEGGLFAGESAPSRIERLHQIFLAALAGEHGPTGGYRPDAAADATLAVIDWRLLTEGGQAERDALDRLLDNLPSSLPAPVRARAMVAAAEAFAYMEEWPAARTWNARARSIDGDSAVAWIQAGLLDVADGSRTRAMNRFRRAFEIAPARADTSVYLDLIRSTHESEVGDVDHD